VIAWLEASYHSRHSVEEIMIWEADEDNGRLVLHGDPEVCKSFQEVAGFIIAKTHDPTEDWRY
jgi:hypothetical protein